MTVSQTMRLIPFFPAPALLTSSEPSVVSSNPELNMEIEHVTMSINMVTSLCKSGI